MIRVSLINTILAISTIIVDTNSSINTTSIIDTIFIINTTKLYIEYSDNDYLSIEYNCKSLIIDLSSNHGRNIDLNILRDKIIIILLIHEEEIKKAYEIR